MTDADPKPEVPACGHKASDLELYQAYRGYVVNEDELINNRVGWFIQLHSFLIASYGIVVAAIIGTFFPQSDPSVPPIFPQGVACLLLVGITLIGLRSSETASKSIVAADRAISALRAAWVEIFMARGGGLLLPGLTGGGDPQNEDDGAQFHLILKPASPKASCGATDSKPSAVRSCPPP